MTSRPPARVPSAGRMMSQVMSEAVFAAVDSGANETSSWPRHPSRYVMYCSSISGPTGAKQRVIRVGDHDAADELTTLPAHTSSVVASTPTTRGHRLNCCLPPLVNPQWCQTRDARVPSDPFFARAPDDGGR